MEMIHLRMYADGDGFSSSLLRDDGLLEMMVRWAGCCVDANVVGGGVE